MKINQRLLDAITFQNAGNHPVQAGVPSYGFWGGYILLVLPLCLAAGLLFVAALFVIRKRMKRTARLGNAAWSFAAFQVGGGAGYFLAELFFMSLVPGIMMILGMGAVLSLLVFLRRGHSRAA